MSITKDPIAVIGIGCRFPGGASNPRQFWRNLCQGQDAITDVPADRWDVRKFYDPNPDKPGKSNARQAGFLKDNIFHFDPLFFGISPREAETLDPQQRLLLEVAWEAVEDAGLQIERLRGSRTGVFIGGFMLDNLALRVNPMSREHANTHTGASCTMTMLSNRISYTFDLRGPSVSMDTACSSSLVAAHFACQSIWNGESDMVLTGGVNVMLRPEFPIVMSKGKFLSAHSRCMAFDMRAGGYVRGEGAGVVILKPLASAQADRDHIYALIRMTGSNQDGHTSGISMPNAEAQEQLIREVYRNAGIPPGDVYYVEAHGTGTQAGDPKELQALDAVLSTGRSAGDKCVVGSVKTNIGHLEAAAGVAGLIKAAYCLEQKKIPPNLHFVTPNPNIPLQQMCLRIPTTLEDWPDNSKPRYAGINSFGYGGTNAHVLLEQAPRPNLVSGNDNHLSNGPWLAPVSARSESALRDLTAKYAMFLSSNQPDISLENVLHTLCHRRSHHSQRLIVSCNNLQELREHLQYLSAGEQVAAAITGTAEDDDPALVFIYTGMGPQWWGMGRELMQKEPVFMQALQACDQLFVQESGRSIIDELMRDEADSQITRTEIAQPANFAIQIALTRLWNSYGIEPAAVIGHSVGEVAAAYVSGALTLADAIKVSVHRSRLQGTTAGKGSMLAAGLQEQDAQSLIENYAGVSVAAINSPASVTLSGDRDQLESISRSLNEQSIFNRFLHVEVAYHSQQMDPIQDELLDSLAPIKPRDSLLPFYSTVTGDMVPGSDLKNEYWWRNVREPVRFKQGIDTLLGRGFKTFLEIGPHPVLGHSVQETALRAGKKVNLAASLNRKHPELKCMSEAVARLYTLGHTPDWGRVIPPGGRFIMLPTYPWQKERFWSEPAASIQDRLGSGEHIFFNSRLPGPNPSWSVEINEHYFPFLPDHQVNKAVVFPGAAYLEAGLGLSRLLGNDGVIMLQKLDFTDILRIQAQRLQVLSIDYQPSTQRYSIYSRYQEEGAEWELKAAGNLLHADYGTGTPTVSLPAIRERFTAATHPDDMYGMLSRRGLDYGPWFRRVRELWTLEDEFLIRIDNEQPDGDYLLHPVTLDACFHTVLALVPGNAPYVPVSIEDVIYYTGPDSSCWCHGVVTHRTESTIEADLFLVNEDGMVAAEIRNSFFRALPNLSEQRLLADSDIFYTFTWDESQRNTGRQPEEISACLYFTGDNPLLSALQLELEQRRIETVRVLPGESCVQTSDDSFQINTALGKDYEFLLNNLAGRRFSHIIYCWPLLDPHAPYGIENISKHCMQLVRLVQSLVSRTEISLIIVTRFAQIVSGSEDNPDLNNSPLWGIAPLIQSEYPNIRYKLVDIDDHPGLNLYDVITCDKEDTDIAVRDNRSYLKSLNRYQLNPEHDTAEPLQISTAEPVRLTQSRPGQLDALIYESMERPAPGQNEVEIKTHSACLNFKDILKVYGTLPETVTRGTYFGKEIGMEICGTICRTGSEVQDFKVGDVIVAPIAGGFRSYALLPATFLMHVPPGIEPGHYFIHIGYLTAYYGLVRIANLQKNEKILIHSATGGLGLAAVQIARWKGAEIFATSGTEAKRDYLRSLGVQHVLDSRTLGFARAIHELTGGRGVDVVLNSLSGDALKAGFSLLAPYGRFIEVGKKEISENDGLPMAVFNRNITFAAIDIDRMHAERPQLVRELLAEIDAGFRAGNLKPLPTTFFTARDTVAAFRYMARAEHIGKIVVTFDDSPVSVMPRKRSKLVCREDASYLITGGTSGFGLEVARWLADQEAGHIILASRSGAATEAARTAMADIRSKGINISVASMDVSDLQQVESTIARIRAQGPPLRGILHAAMVLDDAFLKDLDGPRFTRVLMPKVAGLLNLYHCTRELGLDFLVSFSSISALIGNRGQANYVAANSFLDEFSRFAHSQGFPAISINWGVLEESGIVARNRDLIKLFEQEGISGLTNQTALNALGKVLSIGLPQIGIFNVDWSRWRHTNDMLARSTRFRKILADTSGADSNGINQNLLKWREVLKTHSADESYDQIANTARNGLAAVLRLSPDKIGMDQKLDGLGIDSLILLELSMTLREIFGIDMSAAELFKQPTLTSLTHEVIKRLGKGLRELN